MRQLSVRKYTVPGYLKDALAMLKPPESITVSQWAERHRKLDSKTSAIPGSWNNSVTPYLVGIMDEFNNYATEEIIFIKPTQVGGTEAMLNMIGYAIDQDPSPTLVVYPTDDLAKPISKKRITDGLIMLSDTLSKKYRPDDSTWDDKEFGSMHLLLTGSNSPSALASWPIRFLFMDEVDKYPSNSGKEASPISLAKERTKTFKNKKIVMASTPTLKTGHIWKAKEDADCEKHYFVPCPHCGCFIELKFAQIKFPNDEGMSYADRAEFAAYVCQECGEVITDSEKPLMLANGKWEVVRQDAEVPTRVAFWMNTLYSPFTRFSEIAKEFLKSKDDPDIFQNFVNSWLAEPWEDTKLKTSADLVMERQTEYEQFEIPDEALLLTAGVDVQETSLYWTIRAWGKYLTSWNIAHGQAFSFPQIEQIMNREYTKRNGDPMIVNLCLVDSGDQTDAVYDFCAYNSDWSLPVKGSSGGLESHYRISKVNKTDSRAYGMKLVLVDGGKYKDMIAGRMQRPNGRGSWMVYNGCDIDYAEMVTSEHKINAKSGSGKIEQRWVPKTSHADNHYLDAEVYCMAAADVLGARMLHLRDYDESAETLPEITKDPPPAREEQWIKTNEDWLR